MPISQRHVIMCDDVRQENSGKFILIGMYTPDMNVPQFPFVVPSLAFFAWLESDRIGSFPFRMRLEHLESGQAVVEGMGMMQFPRPGVGISIVKFGGVRFTNPGAYVFSMSFDGQTERLLTQFSVTLQSTPPQLGQATRI
jgi:hypothetical protein